MKTIPFPFSKHLLVKEMGWMLRETERGAEGGRVRVRERWLQKGGGSERVKGTDDLFLPRPHPASRAGPSVYTVVGTE